MRKALANRPWLPLLAIGSAWWVDKLATIEWSYPYCSVLDDGPAGAVFGFPFPHRQASIVASASDIFIPWLYVVDLVLIAGLLFVLLLPLVAWLEKRHALLCKFLVATSAVVLIATAAPFETWVVYNGISSPTDSFSGNLNYSELRPVALRILGRQRDCTASPFWFR